jgi:hypothetical protein
MSFIKKAIKWTLIAGIAYVAIVSGFLGSTFIQIGMMLP